MPENYFKNFEKIKYYKVLFMIKNKKNGPRQTVKTSNIKSISILSAKGGTGKTSIAVSIGYLLAHCGFKTLLVDMDLFTHGITVYTLAAYPGEISVTLTDIFTETDNGGHIHPFLIPDPFVNDKLFILPSIDENRAAGGAQVFLSKRFNDITPFTMKLEDVLRETFINYEFDYVIIDTRGGPDHTSIGSALATGSYIVITEADKPSWSMSRLLLQATDEMEKKINMHARREGFIINKNVLPPGNIESFLKKKWGISHLGTIPADIQATRCFQENRAPVSEKTGCAFSEAIIKIVQKPLFSETWSMGKYRTLKRLTRQGLMATLLDILKI